MGLAFFPTDLTSLTLLSWVHPWFFVFVFVFFFEGLKGLFLV